MESLTIHEPLGPISPTPHDGMRLYPFTLLIGRDGVKIRLLMWTVHFFRNRRWLLFQHLLALPHKKGREEIVLDVLRKIYGRVISAGIVSFPLSLLYTAGDRQIGVEVDREGNVSLSSDFAEEVEEVLDAVRGSSTIPVPSAAYITADRDDVFYLNSFRATKGACELAKTWTDGTPDTSGGKWIREITRQMMGGEMHWDGKRWVWRHGNVLMPVSVLPAGQKHAWPILCIGEALFTWRERGGITPDFALHIEEPEAHLYPEAQGAVVYSLAYLVNSGFRVLAYTHSLLALYLVNNLIAASEIPREYSEPGIPPPEVRLKRGTAGGYYITERGEINSLLDEETGYISEAELGRYGERLMVMANRIDVVSAYWPEV